MKHTRTNKTLVFVLVAAFVSQLFFAPSISEAKWRDHSDYTAPH